MQCCLLNCSASRHLIWYDDVLQITRSIGDVYLKKPEFNKAPLHSKFRLQGTFRRPFLSSDPAITVHQIQSTDKFIIFASDGLWEQLSNQEAVDMVQSSPRNVRILILCLSFYIFVLWRCNVTLFYCLIKTAKNALL
jgi:pyruvate dehydrogenase phosphatase